MITTQSSGAQRLSDHPAFIYVTYHKISEVPETKFTKGEVVEMCHSDLPLNFKANFAN
jgi:hypothetical protein